MSHPKQSAAHERRWETSVPDHYAALTTHMLNFGGNLLACHFGLWGPNTTNDREALLRANQTLVQGCDLSPGRRVLDAGSGVGGTAITLAETHGIHVTGLTNCEPHVAVAAEHAERRGVGHLVEFLHGDFMDLQFPNAHFDAVLNHETFCYAPDKRTYLQGIFRVLKPGGRWQCLEGLLGDKPLSETQEEAHVITQRGWRMPPLEPCRDVLATLKEVGFERITDQDLSAEVAPATEKIRKRWLLFTFVTTPTGGQNRASQEFMEATMNYDQGLQEGVFTYRFISGTRPC
ncbi:MAG: methyltransferase domain-containing protein [Alphaproteobacteria bacterium]|nr:methyltransferase domain-containing protein [Alphaproteobacteria bacterium]